RHSLLESHFYYMAIRTGPGKRFNSRRHVHKRARKTIVCLRVSLGYSGRMQDRVLCFFHANCVDGAASAAVIKKKYPQAKCYPMNHGDRLRARPKGKNLYIVDFSFRPELMLRFQEEAQSVHWYDHHVTALPIREQIGWGEI